MEVHFWEGNNKFSEVLNSAFDKNNKLNEEGSKKPEEVFKREESDI